VNILYIGNHGQPNNDDEGAISWGFRQLGHTVTEVHENSNFNVILNDINFSNFDFALFHKTDPAVIKKISEYIECVCWFFDGINKGFEFNDVYIEEVKKYHTKMFFTDGDYVHDSKNKNFFSLKQGFDSRKIKLVNNIIPSRCISFLGNINHNAYNERFLTCDAVKKKYNDLFICDLNFNIFQDTLTEYCQTTKIMLAMPPVTDMYWSNRVYVLGGRGAFLIHPSSQSLKELLPCLPMYTDASDLCNKIEYFLANPKESLEIRKELQTTIIEKYKYKDRCEDIIKTFS
jgi:hypothetical protein